jgi:hypothetical protein
MFQEPICVFFTRMCTSLRPSVAELPSKFYSEFTEPEIIFQRCSHPDCAGVVNMNRSVTTLIRIFQLTWSFPEAKSRRSGKTLLVLADSHYTIFLEK